MSTIRTSPERSLWPGSTWDRACRELFDGDRRQMLAWGRRYLAAYPAVHAEAFHLGARFREIVGARNRLHWWRTGVDLLSGQIDVPRASSVAETATAYGRGAALDDGRAPSDAAERLRVFDLATERQRKREAATAAAPADAAAGRGWTRAELYE